ncbi:hypothetical protein ACTFIU_002179 [Dictyostelium citrinum]
MNIRNKEDLMAIIKTYVTIPFKGYFHSEIYNDENYIIYYSDAENFTTHFFLCDDRSIFGKKWNNLVGSFVRTKIKNVTSQSYEFDTILLETLKDKMKANIKNPTRIPQKDQEILINLEKMFNDVKAHTIDIKQVPMYSIVPDIRNNEYEQWKYALNNKDIIFIDNLLIVTGSFNPTYDYISESQFSHSLYYDKNEKVRYLKVSGNRKLNYRASPNVTRGDSDDSEITINEYPSADGEFDLRIPIDANYSKYYSNHFHNGVLTLTFKEELTDLPDESCK